MYYFPKTITVKIRLIKKFPKFSIRNFLTPNNPNI